jgi:hypothetical protein
VQAFPFSFLISLSLNRQTDVGSYHIQLRLQTKCEIIPVMRLDVNPEGNDYFCFPNPHK